MEGITLWCKTHKYKYDLLGAAVVRQKNFRPIVQKLSLNPDDAAARSLSE